MTDQIAARANALILLVAIAVLSIVGAMAWDGSRSAQVARDWSRHTIEVIGAVKDLDLAIRQAETSQRGFLLTGEDDYLSPFAAAIARIDDVQGRLQVLTADNKLQQQRLKGLAPLMRTKTAELSEAIAARRSGGAAAALRIVRTDVGLTAMKAIEATFADMRNEEAALLATRESAAARRGAWTWWLTTIGGVGAIAALVAATVMLNRALGNARRLEDTQRSLATRLRMSLDSLSQGVAVFGPDMTLTNWNECFQALLDLPKSFVRVGTPYAAFVDRSSVGEAAPLLEREDQIGHGSRDGVPVIYERTRSGGHVLEFRRTRAADGGFVLTVSDLTKRAQAEAILREAQKMQAIGQLTGGIAHDFNNLLTVILGNLEFVTSKLGEGHAMQSRVERAARAAQRGATLTAQLLSFARRQPLAPTPIDLAASMPDLVPLLRRTLGEHIDVRFVESAGLWPAMADAAQLESAILNLALNARDAMPGGGRLTIEMANTVIDRDYAGRHAEVVAGDYAMLAVSDTGHGMPPDIVARVFEPFFTTKPDGKGTGLGLAMVFGFVKQSGGHVKVYSEPGEGTTIKIYLPRAATAPTVGQEFSAPIDLPRGSATVLVVEDDPAVREIAAATLMDLGYRVLEARNGDEGLRVHALHASEIAMVLTDVVMPGKIRGREMAERIVAINPRVRIVFMSGYTENSIVHGGRLDEGVHLIGKPFRREQLARKVAEVMGDGKPATIEQAGANVIDMKRRNDT